MTDQPPTPDEVQVRIHEILEQVGLDTQSFNTFKGQGSTLHQDAMEAAASAQTNLLLAQTLMLSQIGLTLSTAFGSQYDIGLLVDRVVGNTQSIRDNTAHPYRPSTY